MDQPEQTMCSPPPYELGLKESNAAIVITELEVDEDPLRSPGVGVAL